MIAFTMLKYLDAACSEQQEAVFSSAIVVLATSTIFAVIIAAVFNFVNNTMTVADAV